MADPRFFRRAGPFALDELARIAGADIGPGAAPDLPLSDVAPLDTAGKGDISFLSNRKYADRFRRSAAGACIVGADAVKLAPDGMALLVAADPYLGYARIAAAFYPDRAAAAGISPRASVHPEADIGEGAAIEPFAVVEAGARIGAGCEIGAGSVIRENVEIGAGCRIGANVSISHAILGARVRVYSGARIGEPGFGFAPSAAGHVSVPQLGRVLIGDDVEIGANTTIDRGAGPDTVIGDGCRIDNLVQIGHNVVLGKGCIIVAQVGISGSTTFEDFVSAGGQSGFAGHLKIGKGARVAAQSGLMKDVPPGMSVGGTPAVPIREFFRQTALVAQLVRKKGE